MSAAEEPVTVQTVTVDGKPVSQRQVCSSAEVQTHRIEHERLAKRNLLRAASGAGLTVVPEQIRVTWTLTVEAVGWDMPAEMRARLEKLEQRAQLFDAEGLAEYAEQLRRDAAEIHVFWVEALDRLSRGQRAPFPLSLGPLTREGADRADED